MPVTARLSKRLYDRLGEEIANELVEWFNQVDSASRNDLRERIDLNFARFDAKLEQRLAQREAKWDQRIVQLEAKWEQHLTRLEAKWEHRISRIEARLDGVADKESLTALRAHVEHALLVQTRWMFVAWASLMLTVVLRT